MIFWHGRSAFSFCQILFVIGIYHFQIIGPYIINLNHMFRRASQCKRKILYFFQSKTFSVLVWVLLDLLADFSVSGFSDSLIFHTIIVIRNGICCCIPLILECNLTCTIFVDLLLCCSYQCITIKRLVGYHDNILCSRYLYCFERLIGIININILNCIFPLFMLGINHIDNLILFLDEHRHHWSCCRVSGNAGSYYLYGCSHVYRLWRLRILNDLAGLIYRITYQIPHAVHILDCIVPPVTTFPFCIESHGASNLLVFHIRDRTVLINVPAKESVSIYAWILWLSDLVAFNDFLRRNVSRAVSLKRNRVLGSLPLCVNLKIISRHYTIPIYFCSILTSR